MQTHVKQCNMLVLFFSLVGCGNSEISNSSNENSPGGVKHNKLYQATFKEYENMVTGKNGFAEIEKRYENDEEAASDSDYVIYGEIDNVSYRVDEGMISTVQTFEVIECFKGNVSPGDTLSVVRDSGYVTVKNYLDSFSDEGREKAAEDRCGTLSKEEKENKYIGIRTSGSLDSECGVKILYCLVPSSDFGKTG